MYIVSCRSQNRTATPANTCCPSTHATTRELRFEVDSLRSFQRLPVIEYPSTLGSSTDDRGLGNRLLYETHRKIQQLIAEFVNEDMTNIVPPKPSQVAVRKLKHVSPNVYLVTKITSLEPALIDMLFYEAPTKTKAALSTSHHVDI